MRKEDLKRQRKVERGLGEVIRTGQKYGFDNVETVLRNKAESRPDRVIRRAVAETRFDISMWFLGWRERLTNKYWDWKDHEIERRYEKKINSFQETHKRKVQKLNEEVARCQTAAQNRDEKIRENREKWEAREKKMLNIVRGSLDVAGVAISAASYIGLSTAYTIGLGAMTVIGTGVRLGVMALQETYGLAKLMVMADGKSGEGETDDFWDRRSAHLRRMKKWRENCYTSIGRYWRNFGNETNRIWSTTGKVLAQEIQKTKSNQNK